MPLTVPARQGLCGCFAVFRRKAWGGQLALTLSGCEGGLTSWAVASGVRLQGSGILPDTVTVDHGKVCISAHIINACAELGISLQPARKYTATDKAPIERFFKTLGMGLFDLLPGYKGENIEARGIEAEGEAIYLVSQLEEFIREWVGTVYHLRPVDSLSDDQMPGLRLSLMDRYAHGIAAAGAIVLLRDLHLAIHLLPVTFHELEAAAKQAWPRTSARTVWP
jgi:transposase InsO family protein